MVKIIQMIQVQNIRIMETIMIIIINLHLILSKISQELIKVRKQSNPKNNMIILHKKMQKNHILHQH